MLVIPFYPKKERSLNFSGFFFLYAAFFEGLDMPRTSGL
jgi:hypothetical protein